MKNAMQTIDAAGAESFVGRNRELEQFAELLRRMLDGRRQLLLVSGDPGIGKTTLAEAIADAAEDRGALVIWARCYEEPGAPPYWPWTQALRAYADASSLDEIRLTIGGDARDIAAILPEIEKVSHETVPAHEASVVATNANARFRTFAAVARFLGIAADSVPIVLIIDNLHWADGPSLSLLEFCCQELSRKRLLICATYRDSEVHRKCPLYETLGGLSSLAGTSRMPLGGLSEAEIGQLATDHLGRALPASILHPVCKQADGNPLFARELVKFLVEEVSESRDAEIAVHVPDSIRETIGRRLSRLPRECNRLLRTAAVFGRYFDVTELAVASGETVLDTCAKLEAAIDARIVEAIDGPAGKFRFAHALIRETLYEESSALDKLRLHAQAGDTLLNLHPDCPPAVLSRLAHHYGESASMGNAEKAAEFGLRAARSAVRVCAYEEAVVHFDRVIAVLDLFASADDERVASAYLGKGVVLKELGEVERSIEALLNAIHRIRTLDNVGLVVDVLMRLTISTSHASQAPVIPLLEATLDALPPEDDVARARTTLLLAFANCNHLATPELISQVTGALNVAKRLGAGQALCDCYHLAQMALRAQPRTLEIRMKLGEEHVACASDMRLADHIAESYHWQSLNLLEAGDIENLNQLLQAFGNLPATRYGLHQYRFESLQITTSLLRGEWDKLDQRIERLRDLGGHSRRDDAVGVYGAQMFALQRDLGRLDTLAPMVSQFIDKSASEVWQPGLMLLCIELESFDEARQIFEELAKDRFAGLRKDEMYLTCLVFCAETCAVLGDRKRAGELVELLSPYENICANHPTAVCYGAVAYYLGMLAATLDEEEKAAGYFENALDKHRSMNAWPWLVRTQVRFAAMLLRSDNEAARNRGRKLLGEAEPLANRLNMCGLAKLISDLLTPSSTNAAPDGLTAREVEVLELMAIGRSNRDISTVLSISLNTVATHVRSILMKSGCANRTEAAAYAMRHNLDNPSR